MTCRSSAPGLRARNIICPAVSRNISTSEYSPTGEAKASRTFVRMSAFKCTASVRFKAVSPPRIKRSFQIIHETGAEIRFSVRKFGTGRCRSGYRFRQCEIALALSGCGGGAERAGRARSAARSGLPGRYRAACPASPRRRFPPGHGCKGWRHPRGEPDAARRHEAADCGRLVGAVNPVQRLTMASKHRGQIQ